MNLAHALPAALALSLTAGAASAATAVTPQDRVFVTAAAMGGMAEVSDASLALARTKSPVVKTLAKTIEDAHTKADAKLATIARAKNVALPSGIGPVNEQMKGSLESLHGPTFDTAYIQGQKLSHAAAIATFQQEIAKGSDPDLVAFAKATLPDIRSHTALISRDLVAQRGKTGASMNDKAAAKQ